MGNKTILTKSRVTLASSLDRVVDDNDNTVLTACFQTRDVNVETATVACDALNVKIETGFTASELVEQKKQLLQALSGLLNKCNVVPNSQCAEGESPYGEAYRTFQTLK